jgi:hypothetical protein
MPNKQILELQDLVIFQDEDGSYNLFGKYIITKHSPFEYVVTAHPSSLDLSFGTLRNATAWCIMDKREKLYEARRIQELDRALSGLDLGVLQHQKMLRKAKTPDDQLIYFAKLTEERLRKKRILDELDGHVLNTKHWQTKRFTQ